jgi:N-acetylglucosaminyl-diphospho-decaprenol L-rhamnosyltransferase
VKLSVIVVTHNSGSVLSECLHALRHETSAVFEIIVIDNASSDNTVSILASDFRLRFHENRDNAGFAAACNQGLALGTGEYFVLLNPDVIVHHQALDHLISWLDANPLVGIVGPQSTDATGALQHYGTARPGVIGYIRRILRFDARSAGAVHDRPAVETDWVSGFCLMARRSLLNEVGWFDEGFFMYSEDVDWCLRARHAGWKVVLLRNVEVIHPQDGGHAARSDYAARIFNVKQGQLRLFAHHHRYSTYLLVKGLVAVECVVKLCWDLPTYSFTSPPKRTNKAARIRGYWSLLRSLGDRPRFMAPGTGGSLLPAK